MLPTVVAVISRARRLFPRSSKRRKEAAPAVDALPEPAEGPGRGRQGTLVAAGSPPGQDLATLRDQGLSLPGLYETWVELEQRVTQAQSDFQAILATRKEAATLRRRAQEVLNEGEAIREEAQRISEVAWQALERGFAVNARGFPDRWTTAREIDEAMKTYTALQRATHSEAWQEADRTRQRATAELLKALSSLSTALSQAVRELKEAANLPAVADSLKQSAQEQLRCAQAIRNELLLLGQEALSELDTASAAQYAGSQGITISGPAPQALGPKPGPGLLGTVSLGPSGQLAGTEASSPAAEVAEVPEQPASGASPVAAPSGSVAAMARELESQRAGDRPLPQAGPPPRELERTVTPAADQAPVPTIEPKRPSGARRREPQPTAAELLRREIEAAASAGSSAGTRPVPPAPESLPPPDQGAEARSPAGMTPREQPHPSNSADVLRPVQGAGETLERQPDLAPVPAASYTGRLYLMFPSSLSQGRLEAVWEALDQVAGSGAIADTRLISRDAGIQFTLELGPKTLDIGQLHRKLPGAALEPLEPDRVRIDWPG